MRNPTRSTRKTSEEIAEEMAKGYYRPFTGFGKQWQGDIFFSDIYTRTKKHSAADTQRVADLLRSKGYYVHTNPTGGAMANPDTVLARELALYASNDQQIYNSRLKPFIINYGRRKAKGTFNKTRAIEGLANNLAKDIQNKYWKEFSPSSRPPAMDQATKMAFGREMLNEIEEAIDDFAKLGHNPGAKWHGQAIKEGKKRQKMAKTAEERHWYAGQVAGHWGSYLESKGRGMPNPRRNTANGYIGPPIVDRTAPASETKKEESGTGTGILVAIAVVVSVAWLANHHRKEA